MILEWVEAGARAGPQRVVQVARRQGQIPVFQVSTDQMHPWAHAPRKSRKLVISTLLENDHKIVWTPHEWSMMDRFKHKNTKGRINIQLKTTRGDPDLYVGNHHVPYPVKEDHIWRMGTLLLPTLARSLPRCRWVWSVDCILL